MATLSDLYPAYGIRPPQSGSNLGSLMALAQMVQGGGMSQEAPQPSLASYGAPAGGSGTLGSIPAVPASGDRVAFGRQIYDYFVGRGLQPHQAAAVAGNMAWESGGRTDLVNPGDNVRNSPNSPHSIGIAQWNDRAPALVSYARGQGIDIPAGDLRDPAYARTVAGRIPLQTQLDFAWNEMQGPERRAYSALTAAPDLRSATAGAIGYHRPAGFTWGNPYAGHGFDRRLGLANQILGY
jgi:hypothetical protein